ncbi:MAG: ferrous iron transport protein B [Helicobacter sp.]|nr:ferrous iron transport protein B [Helicobacter sp.]
MQTITIALVGQPNVGKSSLINAIAGSNLKVGNFSGVTIEKTQTTLQYKNYILSFVDLPGIYALNGYSMEERITTQFLCENDYDLIVNVLDCTNLARNLMLSLQLTALSKKMLLALNMSDEAKKEGLQIDHKTLEQKVGVDSVSVSAKNKENITSLLDKIIDIYKSDFHTPIQPKENTTSAQEHITKAHQIATSCTIYNSQTTMTQKLDSVFLNKYCGIAFFLFFMWLLFELTFRLGEYPKVWIEDGMGAVGEILKEHISSPSLASLISDGIIAGIGAVLSFLPHILLLFLGITLLETTGYMARVAYLLDGFLYKFGLHGKSFIPLVTGFGCSVPAYMATRTLKNQSDKILTLFIINFMSCSARLPIYTLFVGIFFPSNIAGSVLFGIYIFGAVVGLFIAKLLKLSVFKGHNEPFVMEIPKYRLPSMNLVVFSLYQKALMYVKKAGGFILLASMLVWFGTNYPNNPALLQEYENKVSALSQNLGPNEEKIQDLQFQLHSKLLEQSFLGRIGEWISPVFSPMGFDWRLCVSLLNGLAAKEVVISSMGVLYALGEGLDEEDENLQEVIAKNVSFPTAIAFILFVMFYNPCLAPTAVFAKESGSWRYVIVLFVFTSIVAYILSFIGYKAANWFG